MYRKVLLVLSFIFVASCNCQKKSVVDVENNEVVVSNEKIKNFLRASNFEIVSTADLVIDYQIEKSLISGTTDEYSNKVVFNDTLKKEKANSLLLHLKDDSSYDWTSKNENFEFNPTRQFLIKNDTSRIFLLVDEKSNMLGFINLEGQSIVKFNSNFSKYFKKL